MVIDAGQSAGIPVAMCGEMAGDPRYTRLLLGMGLTEFSMHPSALQEIKRVINQSSIGTLAPRVGALLQSGEADQIIAGVDAINASLH
jgi:phosphotransferase system enzyme I (PtsI)